jgi:phytoene/squalene synthetase
MFSHGGLAVLDAIEAIGYDTLHRRPEVSKLKQASLLGRTLITHVFSGSESQRNGRASQKEARRVSPAATPADLSASYSHCHQIARTAHSSFYPAFFLLPKAKRDGIVALYAFMRLIDDVSDEGENLAAKQRGHRPITGV